MSAPAAEADPPHRSPAAPPPTEASRQMYIAGGLAAASAAAIGLATLVTLTLIGWVAAPHASFGQDIRDVLLLAAQMWLVGHHVGFSVPGGGEISLLPIGLVVIPGLLLYRSGRRLASSQDIPRVRGVFRAALAIAGPYAALAGTLALVAQSDSARPSMVQALVAGFVIAYTAGGLGVLRQLLIDKRIARRRLLRLMPPRTRSLVVGTLGASVALGLAGITVVAAGVIGDFDQVVATTQSLRPGLVGGMLLLLLQLLYLPNAVIYGVSYAAGPGFAVGSDSIVAPTGVNVGAMPALPILAAVPENGPAPVLSLLALAAPFLAGIVGGVMALRTTPARVSEAAPMWGFACGACTGALWAALALLAAGSLGAERLAAVGPSAWQVGLIVALEVGVAAAIAGWVTNWWHFRRAIRDGAARLDADGAESDAADASAESQAAADTAPAAAAAEPAADTQESAATATTRTRRRIGWPWRRRGRPAASTDDDTGLVFGVTYEAGAADATPAPTEERPAEAPQRSPVVFDDAGATVTYLSEHTRRRHSGRERD